MIKNLSNKCIWLIGKSSNVDIIWQSCEFKIKKDIENINCINLFDNFNYKYVFNKENAKFLQSSNRNSWNNQILIKGIEEVSNCVNEKDACLFIDKMEKKTLFKAYIEEFDIKFNQNELEFINKLEDLGDLAVCKTLKDVEIEFENWNYFVSPNSKTYFKKISQAFFEPGICEDNIVPSIYYALKALSPSSKSGAILTFLNASIKNKSQIWEQNNLWKELLKSL